MTLPYHAGIIRIQPDTLIPFLSRLFFDFCKVYFLSPLLKTISPPITPVMHPGNKNNQPVRLTARLYHARFLLDVAGLCHQST